MEFALEDQFSILNLVHEASWVVKVVMLLLLAASLVSWFIIAKKRRLIVRARSQADAFENEFWSGGDLSRLYQGLERKAGKSQGMAGIFEAGFREFSRIASRKDIQTEKLVESSRRAMRVAQTREVDRLEQSLATLATIGSTSPYVGLFGTVWGIMDAFIQLGNSTQTATLELVAPGIAEALIATAMGLFAAIPAVIFYNRYADQVNRIENRFDNFVEEFSTILERHSHSPRLGQ
ncbi:MAG: protein TolQ [Pseudomonadota bacterium]